MLIKTSPVSVELKLKFYNIQFFNIINKGERKSAYLLYTEVQTHVEINVPSSSNKELNVEALGEGFQPISMEILFCAQNAKMVEGIFIISLDKYPTISTHPQYTRHFL